MSFNLFDNKPAENLTVDTDLFGTLPKAQFLHQFIEIIAQEETNKTKIIGLYGEWGIGKSSVVNYLMKELKQNHVPILFEAWKYEKDENLVVSLIDYLADDLRKSDGALYKELMKDAIVLLKGFSKAISFKASIIPNVLEVGINGKEITESIENFDTKISQTKLINEFEGKLKAVTHELKVAKGKEKGKIVLFIDDLDRCEPENLLNLITSVKLFLSLSDDIIFFLPIDKNAIKSAIQHRYNDAIKSEQYLEKVFDITFNLESEIHYATILQKYFSESVKMPELGIDFASFINSFLKSLNFTNPRSIKKLINKYMLVAWIKYESNFDEKTKGYIPNIFHPNHKEFSILETILTVYIIILHDFHSEIYEETYDLNGKLSLMAELSYKHTKDTSNHAQVLDNILKRFKEGVNNLTSKDLNLKMKDMSTSVRNANEYYSSPLRCLYVLISSKKIKSFYIHQPADKDFVNQFKNTPDKIAANFFIFFENHIDLLTHDRFPSEHYTLTNIFRMVKIVS